MFSTKEIDWSVNKLKGYKILRIDTNIIFLYKTFSFYIYNKETNRIKLVTSFKKTFIKRFFSNFRVSNRLLRLEPRNCEKIYKNVYAISFCNNIWIIDISSGKYSLVETKRTGFSTPLNLCSVNGTIYWGDYGSNRLMESVNIYCLNKHFESKVIYSFPKGEIRHIHNIIYDKITECFWIFTGDNEHKAGIYKASKDWTNVQSYKIGQQKYRTVSGFAINGGLLYATDSVEKENYIIFINSQGGEQIITPINGSCIYGGESKEYFYFSTTVEPHESKGIISFFSNKLGKGIKSNEVHLLAVNKKTFEFKIVCSFFKDKWPMKLFQYGVIWIPSGQENNKEIWIYPIGCKNVDGQNILV